MYFSDKIILRTETPGQDADGYPQITVTDTEVWADAKSVNRAEFYAASAAGVAVEIVFAVHAEDYSGQRKVLYGGREYDVVRAYQKGLGTVELTCKAV
jgi:SPP1 family predicted phage head-tail adaptor